MSSLHAGWQHLAEPTELCAPCTYSEIQRQDFIVVDGLYSPQKAVLVSARDDAVRNAARGSLKCKGLESWQHIVFFLCERKWNIQHLYYTLYKHIYLYKHTTLSCLDCIFRHLTFAQYIHSITPSDYCSFAPTEFVLKFCISWCSSPEAQVQERVNHVPAWLLHSLHFRHVIFHFFDPGDNLSGEIRMFDKLSCYTFCYFDHFIRDQLTSTESFLSAMFNCRHVTKLNRLLFLMKGSLVATCAELYAIRNPYHHIRISDVMHIGAQKQVLWLSSSN